MKLPAPAFKKLSLPVLILSVALGYTTQAFASGDDGCSEVWRLVHRDYEGCSNMAFLAPSNDTRVNLLLMLFDLRPAKHGPASRKNPEAPIFMWESLVDALGSPEDKVLLGNSAGTTSDSATTPPPAGDPFTMAVQADHSLSPEDRSALLATRKTIQSGADAKVAAAAIAAGEKAVKTPSGKAYALYLQGAAEFWRSSFDQSAATFSSLTSAQSAWLRETATYMVARADINHAQMGAFDEYGNFVDKWHADANTVAAAEAALDKYLQLYPHGTYAQSARGLKRRGYWLMHDTAKLEAEYGALLLLPPDQRNSSDVELVQEIDNKITTPPNSYSPQDSATTDKLLQSTQSPYMLAMIDLMAMRTADSTEPGDLHASTPLSLSALQQQKPYFATQMPLYEYLLAVHAFYIENKPADVLHIIPDAARQGTFTNLDFSRQLLRGIALEAVKDHNALGFWMQMLPGAKAPFERPALELAIAYHEERAGEIRNVFAANSPVHFPYLREVLLANVADADLLRTQAKNTAVPQHERDLALFTLLFKEATHNHPADFLKDLSMVPADAPTDGYYTITENTDYFSADASQPPALPLGIFTHSKIEGSFGCPTLRATEEQLAQDANNPTALLCVADFVRTNEAVDYLVSPITTHDELGDTPSLFPAGPFVRMETYTAVLANPKASRNDKAYALFRAVNCYGPSGNNGCGGADVPKAQRKAWFTTLKHDYAGTKWANELEYYW